MFGLFGVHERPRAGALRHRAGDLRLRADDWPIPARPVAGAQLPVAGRARVSARARRRFGRRRPQSLRRRTLFVKAHELAARLLGNRSDARPAHRRSYPGRRRGWSQGYQVVAAGQLLLACVLFASLSASGETRPRRATIRTRSSPAVAPTRRAGRRCWPPCFLYGPIEVGTGLWAASVLIESRQFDAGAAGLAITLFFGSIMGGRVLIGFVSDRIGNRRLIRGGLCVALVGVVLLIVPTAAVGVCRSCAARRRLRAGLSRADARDAAPFRPGDDGQGDRLAGRRRQPRRGAVARRLRRSGSGGAGLEAVFPAIACFLVLLLVGSIRLRSRDGGLSANLSGGTDRAALPDER